jgi:hypothetical protein
MRTELEISVSPIFSTPLLVFTPPAHEQIDAQLSRAILEREASVPPHADYEVVGWSSPHDLTMLDWAGEPLRALFTSVIEVATQVTAFSERSGRAERRPDWQVVEVWANVQRQGGSNAAHSHPGSFWAGVYYVDVGEVSSANDRGGLGAPLNAASDSSSAHDPQLVKQASYVSGTTTGTIMGIAPMEIAQPAIVERIKGASDSGAIHARDCQ